MNPAIPLENSVLSASTFLFSTRAFESLSSPEGANLYSPAVSFSQGKFSYSAMIDYTSISVPREFNFDGVNFSNRLIRFQTGYQINDKFSLGPAFYIVLTIYLYMVLECLAVMQPPGESISVHFIGINLNPAIF